MAICQGKSCFISGRLRRGGRDVNYGSVGESAVLTYVVRTVDFWRYGAQVVGVNVSFKA